MPNDFTDHPLRDMEHFIKLARKGKFPGASGGEKRCNKLARMCKPGRTMDNVKGLDSSALNGFTTIIRLIAGCNHDDHIIEMTKGL